MFSFEYAIDWHDLCTCYMSTVTTQCTANSRYNGRIRFRCWKRRNVHTRIGWSLVVQFFEKLIAKLCDRLRIRFHLPSVWLLAGRMTLWPAPRTNLFARLIYARHAAHAIRTLLLTVLPSVTYFFHIFKVESIWVSMGEKRRATKCKNKAIKKKRFCAYRELIAEHVKEILCSVRR